MCLLITTLPKIERKTYNCFTWYGLLPTVTVAPTKRGVIRGVSAKRAKYDISGIGFKLDEYTGPLESNRNNNSPYSSFVNR